MYQRMALVVAVLILTASAIAPTRLASASPIREPHTYIVQPGDTLTTIAAKVGVTSWQVLYAANRERIGNPHVLQVGQVLIIPEAPAAVRPTLAVVGYLPVMTAPSGSAGTARGPSVAAGESPAPRRATDGTTATTESGQAPATVPNPAPMRLTIPTIGLDTVPVPVGLDRANRPVVPKYDVGWYTHSALPGQGENVVLWGHVARWRDTPTIPAPFARLQEVTLGTELEVETTDGTAHRYVVTRMVQVRPDEVQYILPTGTEQLTLVSCIGEWVILDGVRTRDRRLIVIATPVAP
jgi:LPXTG-site transpeptidase (sortase) family protein